jgi:hypothetical protein
MRVVLVRNPSCAAVLGSRVVSCTRSLPWMQLVCIVIPNVIVGNFQIPHQCNALIDHLIPQWSSQDIIYASCDQIKVLWWISNSSKNFLPIKIQSIPRSWTYSFRSCSQLFELKKGVTFEYALHGICIGNLGWTNVHSHGDFHTHILSLVWWCCCPITKGAATEPRASCVLQPHDCH